jgi:antitoxin component YwqK of YwqJK toxin-antitoxin module
MRKLLLLNFLAILNIAVAQIGQESRLKCYEKPPGYKPTWQCGLTPGVIDCQEKLVFDEDRKVVITNNTGMTFTGTCETCYMNGQLEQRVSFVNGKENGEIITYFKSGCTQVTENYVEGLEHGTFTVYYDSTGIVQKESNFYMGVFEGHQYQLTKKGDTVISEYYANDLLHGMRRDFHTNGKLRTEVNYSEGLMDGLYKRYSLDGILVEEIPYKDGKRNGVLKSYFDDGVVLAVENWAMDVKNGEFKVFFYDGVIRLKEFYKKGVPEGLFEERYPNNEIMWSKLYKKGELIEEHRFDENGIETYSFGVEDANGAEDDQMPEDNSEKKTKKKKKEKKKKSKKKAKKEAQPEVILD